MAYQLTAEKVIASASKKTTQELINHFEDHLAAQRERIEMQYEQGKRELMILESLFSVFKGRCGK